MAIEAYDHSDSFGARSELNVGSDTHEIFRLDVLETFGQLFTIRFLGPECIGLASLVLWADEAKTLVERSLGHD